MKLRQSQPDYEKITIYPGDLDGGVRQRLYEALSALGVNFDYEQYA